MSQNHPISSYQHNYCCRNSDNNSTIRNNNTSDNNNNNNSRDYIYNYNYNYNYNQWVKNRNSKARPFLTFPACFSIPKFVSNLNYDCSNFLDVRNLQKQVKKAFCYQKLFWPFTVWINCSSDLKNFENSKFQKFFSITRTIFSHSKSEQYW